MKRYASILVLLVSFTHSLANAVPISAGETLRYDFDFSGVGTTPPFSSANFWIFYGQDNLLNVGEAFKISLYDLSDTYLGHFEMGNQLIDVSHTSSGFGLTPDLSGTGAYALINWKVGSADITKVTMNPWSNTGPTKDVIGELQNARVDAPPSLALLALGLAGFGISRRIAQS